MESFYADDPWFTYIPNRSHYQHPIWPYPPRQRQQQIPVNPKPTRTIPVNYAAHELRSCAAALRIQRVFRGFLVRKSVGKIQHMNNEVVKISERLSRKEVMEVVRKDAKERLKVVETLMSLLLKLDSVKGVDAGVRELRKRVIKKAIALQEKAEGAADVADSRTCKPSDYDRELEENAEKKSGNAEAVMEKMAKENERLVGLVEEMVQRNEKQTRVLGSLAQRVEVLERALVNERLRKKKKKRESLRTLDYCGSDFL